MIPIDAIAHNTMDAINAAMTMAGYVLLIGLVIIAATIMRRG